MSFNQSFEAYLSCVEHTPIYQVIMFSPVMEIYDRYDFYFKDTEQWQEKRRKSNSYILTLGSKDLIVVPYFFIWNDFNVSQLTEKHKGIKWHRHSNEPEYNYDSSKCKMAVDEIKKRNMPVIFEEELKHTIRFIEELAAGVRVIIPHLGGLNGGYDAIKACGLWRNINVYTDTALASPLEISDYIDTYGHDRLLFGSDFPFGDPATEMNKINRLNFNESVRQAIFSGNITKLLSDSNL